MKKLLLFLVTIFGWNTNAQTVGVISTIAGIGTRGFSGDGGAATSAQFNDLQGVAVDASGNVYIADTGNNRIRKITRNGTITTIAGTGASGFSGDGGLATSAQLNNPWRVALDASGNIYISDAGNHRIRKISVSGTITTIAGTGTGGFSGDGGNAASAQINSPKGLFVDAAGNVYIADYDNHRVRKVSAGGIITTISGTGTGDFSGDGDAAASAQLYYPYDVTTDRLGNVYIADETNHRIRKINTTGIITTIAGTGVVGFNGDGGAAISAQLSYPQSLVIDATGNLLIAVAGSHCIRKITPGGTITTIAGTGSEGFNGDGGPATSAQLNNPHQVAIDATGNLYIAEQNNYRVRKVNRSRSKHLFGKRCKCN